MADEKLYEIDAVARALQAQYGERIAKGEKKLLALRARELSKALVPNHAGHTGVSVGTGNEDIPPGKLKKEGESEESSSSSSEESSSASSIADCACCETCPACDCEACICRNLSKAWELGVEKSAPPGFSEKTMHELKAKHGVESAFRIAWAAHKRNAKKGKSTKKSGDDAAIAKQGLGITGPQGLAPGSKGFLKADLCKKCGEGHAADKACATKKTELVGHKEQRKSVNTPGAVLPGDKPSKKVNDFEGVGGEVTPGKKQKPLKKAVPQAKPPSGVNMGTKVPSSSSAKAPPMTPPKAPPAMKAELDKGIMSEAGQKADPASHAMAAHQAAQAPKVTLPGAKAQAGRAADFAAAGAGEFQPKGPVSSGLELDIKPKPGIFGKLGAAPAAKPAVKPGIFGKLGKA